METADVVIAGAGIIGLAVALDLASHGLAVTVLDGGLAMAESSWAAAGMLAANDPENPPRLAELARLSLREYPQWLAQVESLSHSSVPIRTTVALQAIRTGLHLNISPDTARPVSRHQTLSPAELQILAPGLISGNREFLRLEEQSLDPRDLCFALPLAVQAAGVQILEKQAVLSIDASALDGAVIIQTGAGSISAGHFVNCAGAWAGTAALHAARTTPAIAPRKGQMVTVQLNGGQGLDCVLRTPELYLVPRGEGRVVVGATVEHAGFDKTVEPHAIAGLLRAAAELWPPIAQAEVLESWAGLRPGSLDELPIIGPLPTPMPGPMPTPRRDVSEAGATQTPAPSIPHPNCWIAAGHFRNGILLAPATALLISQAIRGETTEIDLAPFHPARFDAESVNSPEPPVPPPSDKPSTAAL